MDDAVPAEDLSVRLLIRTDALEIRDVRCRGTCRHRSSSECAATTHLVFPYRGAFMRHVGSVDTVAEANQLIFFNGDEEYAISHPVEGGDDCLSIAMDPQLLHELAPADRLELRSGVFFNRPALVIDARTQAHAAHLRHGLDRGMLEPLEAETLAIGLVRRSLGTRLSSVRARRFGRRKLVDRTKLLLASAPMRRWGLADIAAEVGVSPVYLTQVFTQVEGVPLYRYQLQLRLARALDLIAQYDDLTMLALDLGFSSHSHFTSTFRRHYGQSPSDFRLGARQR